MSEFPLPQSSSPVPASSPGYDPSAASVSSGSATAWWGRGWALFTAAPVIWIVSLVIVLVVFIVLGFIPLLGQLLLALVGPMVAAGLLYGARELDGGRELKIEHLFEGAKQRAGSLIVLGILYLVATVVVALVVGAVAAGSVGLAGLGAMMGGREAAGMAMGGFFGGMLLSMLLFFVLMIPIMMAVLFAPALIMFHDTSPIDALRQSFAANAKNFGAYIVFLVIGWVLAIVASIPFMLGWLVLAPMMVGAVYAAYKDLFRPTA